MLWIFDATVGSCAVVLLSCVLLRWLGGISSRKQKYAQDGPQLPPGPAGLPFLGCLETLVKGLDPRKAFAWSCSYGPVIRVKTGLSETVILNDLDSIRMFLSHKNMLYRSPSWVQGASVDVGFSAYGGEMWEENRRFSLKLLRELGYGKSGMQSIIADGCEQLMIRIAEAGGQPLDLFQLVLASVCNNIGVLLFGRRYPSGHVKHQELVKSIRDEFMASRRKSMVWLLPSAFIAVARRLPFTTASAVHKTMKSIEAFVRSCEDAVIGRHFVAKGTTVIPNIWAVHNDPKCWDEPEMFDPRRFLNEDGSFAMERLKRVLPFSVAHLRRRSHSPGWARREVSLMGERERRRERHLVGYAEFCRTGKSLFGIRPVTSGWSHTLPSPSAAGARGSVVPCRWTSGSRQRSERSKRALWSPSLANARERLCPKNAARTGKPGRHCWRIQMFAADTSEVAPLTQPVSRKSFLRSLPYPRNASLMFCS
ncbi:vitamin D 25-hydroxylase-like isoform X3 [Amblyomma americanum]